MVSVLIGSAPCVVTACNSSSIECTASRHAAGTYSVVVTVEGRGRASNVGFSSCFTYLLTLSSISPSSGGIAGGYLINITGEGFFNFARAPISYFAKESASLHWLRYGIGLPEIDHQSIRDLNLCPDIQQEYVNRLKGTHGCLLNYKQSYNDSEGPVCPLCLRDNCGGVGFHWSEISRSFPSIVATGYFNCIIIEATIDHLTCVHIFNLPNEVNITVTVFNQEATLVGEFVTSLQQTPVIESISPLVSPVSGGTQITITGTRFTTAESNSSIEVSIGFANCDIDFTNATHVICTTKPHPPGGVPIIMSTSSGVAVWVSADLPDSVVSNYSVSALFEYRLFAEIGEITMGSVEGGTEVDIRGGIFVEGRTQVYVGNEIAEILSIQSDRLVILTPKFQVTEDVDLIAIPVQGLLVITIFLFKNKYPMTLTPTQCYSHLTCC